MFATRARYSGTAIISKKRSHSDSLYAEQCVIVKKKRIQAAVGNENDQGYKGYNNTTENNAM